MPVNVSVYIDGFNLYNGALKNTPYKWLDLYAFAQKLCPSDQVNKVKLFTAQVDRRFDDPQQPVRQRLYWRALRTLPCVEIIEGHFKTRKTFLPEEATVAHIENEIRAGRSIIGLRPTFVEVRRSEEKGTDVNIATHLVHDAHLGRFDAAILVSNDSDLAEAVRIVCNEIRKPVHIFRPSTTRPNAKLQVVATTFNSIDVNYLATSLLPDTLTDARGTFSKPPTW
jgi:uncharacterized LabA/DUF88 family protein